MKGLTNSNLCRDCHITLFLAMTSYFFVMICHCLSRYKSGLSNLFFTTFIWTMYWEGCRETEQKARAVNL